MITVSHDRYFLDDVVDRIFAFEGEGKLVQYEGGYTDYAQAVKIKNGGKGSPSVKTAEDSGTLAGEEEKKKASMKDWKQNRQEKLRFTYKEQKEFETIDDEIAELETKMEKLDADILANATNSMKLRQLMEEKEETEHTLEIKMDRWVYLNDLAERIEKERKRP